ncbi:MAG: ACP S-malonyltransferase, partial [Candidatus Margulisiibacteriota bacterium]
MRTAFVFPGQGSQSVGMGKGFAESFLDEANKILGFDLKQIVLEGLEEELKKTEIQQPAIFVVSVAAFHRYLTSNLQPDAVAGHSLGEYSALYAAGVISFEEAVKIVHLRGKFMQEAVPLGEGAMAAVLGAERKAVEEVCQEVGNV